MRALTWQGRERVRVEDVPDPRLEEPTDAVVRITSTAICGSDLHLFSVLGPFLEPGDVLGHEPMGVVEEVGNEVRSLKPGDRVVIPFVIACGSCWMCSRGLHSQCETTQVRAHGKGAALFGYTTLYGQVPGGQAEYLRVPFADVGPVVVPDDGEPDERYLYLSDVLPTAWQAVEYADVPRAGDDVAEAVRELSHGRGADSVVDAVGMEAHGSPVARGIQAGAGLLPDALARPLFTRAGVDRLAALHTAVDIVRRGGTISLSGVYGGAQDPMPMLDLFDKQVTLRMGQANVHRWVPDVLPLVSDPADPLGVLDLRTHRLSLEDAAHGYDIFQRKEDGAVKVVLDPAAPPARGGREAR